MYLNESDTHRVFDKAGGKCYYCRKQLAFANRTCGLWGAWEIEHKIPRARGGTDEFTNLIAACYDCNRDKSDLTAVSYRRLAKPERVWRENQAIANDLKTWSVALAGIAAIGLRDVSSWFDRKKKERESGNDKPTELKDLPWFGIALLALVVLIVLRIFGDHRGS